MNELATKTITADTRIGTQSASTLTISCSPYSYCSVVIGDQYAHVVDRLLLAVLAWPGAINDQKVYRTIQRNQRVMPGIAPIVHALQASGAKGTHALGERRAAIFGYDHQERQLLEREEGLA